MHAGLSATDPGVHGFRDAAGHAAYRAAYAASLRCWPAPPRERWIETARGVTHLLELGPETGPPLVLLHGASVSATMWGPNVESLTRRHRVLALDTLGDLGLSTAHEMPRTPADCCAWLLELLDALAIERAALIGMSTGGWIAARTAASAPERVAALALIAPGATFARIRLPFILRGLPLLVWPSPSYARAYLRWATTGSRFGEPAYENQLDALAALMHLGFRHFARRMRVFPDVLDDAELERIACPTLLLLGAQEKLYDPQAVLARARARVATLDARIIEDASHDLSLAQPNLVNAALLDFFARVLP